MSQSVEPQHPGIILLEQVMIPLGVSRNKLARDIDVPVGRISDIVNGKRGISADTALRLAKYFGTAPELWMRLQSEFDLYVARCTTWQDVEARVRIFEPNGDEPGEAAEEAPAADAETYAEQAYVPPPAAAEPPPYAEPEPPPYAEPEPPPYAEPEAPPYAEPEAPPYPPVSAPAETAAPAYPPAPLEADEDEPAADIAEPVVETAQPVEPEPVGWDAPSPEPAAPAEPDVWAPPAAETDRRPEAEPAPAWSEPPTPAEAPPVAEAPPAPEPWTEADAAPAASVEEEEEEPDVEPSTSGEYSDRLAASLADHFSAAREDFREAADAPEPAGRDSAEHAPEDEAAEAEEAEPRVPVAATAPVHEWSSAARDIQSELDRFADAEQPADDEEAGREAFDQELPQDEFEDDDVLLLTEEVGPDHPEADDRPPFDRSAVLRRVHDLGFVKRSPDSGSGENIVPFASTPDRAPAPLEEFDRAEPGEPAVRPATRLTGLGERSGQRRDDDASDSLEIPDPADVGPLVRRD